MKSFVEQVKEFMLACGQTVNRFNPDQLALYANLVCEEMLEAGYELPGTTSELKEICDVLWVTIGYALSCGYDIEGAFTEVARSNMSKLVNGVCVKDFNGKVTKGPQYSPANMEPFV